VASADSRKGGPGEAPISKHQLPNEFQIANSNDPNGNYLSFDDWNFIWHLEIWDLELVWNLGFVIWSLGRLEGRWASGDASL